MSKTDWMYSDLAPIPAYIETDKLVKTLRLYRYRPDELSRLISAMGDAIYNEHYRHDGELADMLISCSEQLEDMSRDLSEAHESEDDPHDEPHDPRCKCDDCVAARSDEYHDRKRDLMMMKEE